MSQKYGERWCEAWISEFLGRLALEQGFYNQARQYLSEALVIIRQLGDPSLTAHALCYLGRTLLMLEDYREAEKWLRESLDLSRETDYRFATGLALDGLGQVTYAQGRHEEAQALFSQSADLFREMGDTHRLSRTLNHQGLNSLALNQTVDAQNDFYSALRMAYEGGFLPSALNAVAGLAALEIRQKASQGMLELIIYILQHPSASQETKNRAGSLRSEVESKLPPEEVEAAQAQAGLLSLDEIVRRVLESS